MTDINAKLKFCRIHLCDAQLDLMDYVRDTGYIEPSNHNLHTIYKQLDALIDFIDIISD